jgi:hypothetical protein
MSPIRTDRKSRPYTDLRLTEQDERRQLVVWALVVPSTTFLGAAVFVLVTCCLPRIFDIFDCRPFFSMRDSKRIHEQEFPRVSAELFLEPA